MRWRATAVKIEKAGQRQAFFEWDDGQQGVSLEGEVECGVGSSMAVTVSLPEGGIALLIVAVFDAPVPPDGCGGTYFCFARRLERKKRVWVLES